MTQPDTAENASVPGQSGRGAPADAESAPVTDNGREAANGLLSWPGLPFVAPLAAFLLFTSVEAELTSSLPYEVIYSIKITLCALVLWFCRHAFPTWSSRGVGMAVLLGAAGCAVWVGLEMLQRQILESAGLVSWLPQRAGYEVTLSGTSVSQVLFVGVRLLGLSVLVPLLEELCWRGFLGPFLLDDDFRKVAAGTMTPRSFLIVVAVFTSMHPEILSAVVWCSGMNLLWIRTRNLWACVAAHASTNLVLGGYVLATGSWHLW